MRGPGGERPGKLTWAAEAALQGQGDYSDRGPWIPLNCEVCKRMRQQESNGCHAPRPRGLLWTSITAPDRVVARSRCPRALLNPETDHYDATLWEIVVSVRDGDGGPLTYDATTPAWRVDAARHVRGVWGRMERLRTDHERQKMERMRDRNLEPRRGRG